MKKLSILFTALMLAVTFGFVGCSQDEDPDIPTISVNPTTVSKWQGDTVEFTVSIGTNEKFDKLTISPTSANAKTNEPNEITTFSGTNNATHKYTYVVPGTVTNGMYITITFTIKDNKGTENNTTARINIVQPTTPGPITTHTGKQLGGADNTTIGSFFSCTTGNVYTTNQANSNQASVDLIFTYSSTNGNLMAAPNDANITAAFTNVTSWTTKNATKFTAKLTNITFDNVTDDTEINTQVTTSNALNTRINNLAVNDVFGFITAAGKKGIIKITAISGTQASDRAITFSVKVQQ